ncbi:pyridoxamine 5'-phosphate oxidase family protein [Fulvivirga sedimenti]|uniref:Pyridoxamine 5'-phosphate oxidase family protein n=1 Tax=Fulvivirga sedimenti TaxID=2879465 RepID=A0A9X1KWJ0_9BACT|nr:pyridoxamine 5'-phosphate oxidase family protein [Fulvivirga sedimenti]MCA6073262.1 pyridoxamine 5'-phosphate oxidase family protein [Fulvivirga sedimenti]
MLGKLNSFQCERLFLSETYGRLGCHSEDRTYVIPVSYVYSDGKIYGYTIEGLKIEMMRKNPKVCIQVDHIEDLAHWQSVIAWGEFRELKGKEADDAIHLLTNRLHPFRNSSTSRPKHGLERVQESYSPNSRMIAYEITISEMTGRFEKSQ